MKLKRNIAQILSVGILLNNLSFYSNASISSAEIPNRYETIEGEYITIDDSTEGELVEIEVFGNTVQDENDLSDIQSVGDLYVDDNGNPILDSQGREQYKIDITTCNTINLVDINNYDSVGDNKEAIFKQIIDTRHYKTFTFKSYGGYNSWVKPFQVDSNGNKVVGGYSLNVQSTKGSDGYNRHTFTVPDNVEYIKLQISHPSKNAQLSRGGKDFPIYDYKPLIENKTEILLPYQLQKVGNIADRLYWDNGKGRYMIEKNIYHNILDSSDIYSSYHANNFTVNSNPKQRSNSSFIITGNDGFINTIGTYGSEVWAYINCSEEYLSENNISNDSNSLANYAKNKGTYGFYYQLKEPIIIETNITSKLKIPTYEGKTYIYVKNENGINPTLKVTVDRLPQIAKSAVEEAEVNSIMDNISLARMYINMLPESTYKDQLHNQLSDVFSSDITLDRKTSTANVDVYIKSENMLSLSLNTNSITFEDYSGVEDMKKLNAVNITINSSLPYQLNAYLPSEISNANKTETMSIDTLNIKESSEVDYQTFANNTDKIVLKDNCIKGNNNVHNIDLKLASNKAHKSDIYKTVIKFEVEQK